VAAPGLEGGRTVDALLRPADIAPTLMDLAGVKAETPEPMHGQSFAPLLRGESGVSPHDSVVSATFTRLEDGELAPNRVTPMLYTERWAYAPVGSTGERELYDLAADPQTETNLAEDQGEVADDLHEAFMQELRKLDAPNEAIEVWQG